MSNTTNEAKMREHSFEPATQPAPTFNKLSKIDERSFQINSKKRFLADGTISADQVKRCIDFAFRMSFEEGKQRSFRKGGTKIRNSYEKFPDIFQGKLSECALYDYLKQHGLQPGSLDFGVYDQGQWDTVDILCNGHNISIKSTKHFGNLLLLEEKDWDANGLYIPNKKDGHAKYDELVMVRIKPNLRDKTNHYFWDLPKDQQETFILSLKWEYEITGFITRDDLVYLISNDYLIKRGEFLGKYTRMDAGNYYVQVGNMRSAPSLIGLLKNQPKNKTQKATGQSNSQPQETTNQPKGQSQGVAGQLKNQTQKATNATTHAADIQQEAPTYSTDMRQENEPTHKKAPSKNETASPSKQNLLSELENLKLEGYCSISDLAGKINAVLEAFGIKKKTPKCMNELLMQEGYLYTKEIDGTAMKIATEKGLKSGLLICKGMTSKGKIYYTTAYTPRGQKVVLQELIKYLQKEGSEF